MIMAAGEAGCNPLATGIMSDIFPEGKRALVMAIFNWVSNSSCYLPVFY
jgi:MFS family permease